MGDSPRKAILPFSLVLGICLPLVILSRLEQKRHMQTIAFQQVFAQTAFLLVELKSLQKIGETNLGDLTYIPKLQTRLKDTKARLNTLKLAVDELSQWENNPVEVNELTTKKLMALDKGLAEVLKDRNKNRQSLPLPMDTAGEGRLLGELRLNLIQLFGTGPDMANIQKDDLLPISEGEKLAKLMTTANKQQSEKNSLELAKSLVQILLQAHVGLDRQAKNYAKFMRAQDIFRASRILQSQGYFDSHINSLMLPPLEALYDLSQPKATPQR